MKMNLDEGEEALKNKGKKDFIQILLELKEQEDTQTPITLNQIKALLMVISFPSKHLISETQYTHSVLTYVQFPYSQISL